MAEMNRPDNNKVVSYMEQIMSQLNSKPRFHELRSEVRRSVSQMQNDKQQDYQSFEELTNKMNDDHHAILNQEKKNHATVVADLREQLKKKENELDQLKGRLDEARQAREIDLQQSQIMRKKYDERIKTLEICIQESYERLDELECLKHQQKSEATELENLKTELLKTQMETETNMEHICKLEEQIETFEAAITRLEEEKESLQRELESQKADNETYRKQLADYVERVDAHKQSEDVANKVLEDQLKHLQREYDELKKNLEDEVSKRHQHVTQMADLRTVNRKLTSENAILSTRKGKLERELKEKEEKYKALQETARNLEDKQVKMDTNVRTLEETISSLKNQLEGKEKEYETVSSMKTELQKENKHLLDANKECKTDLEKMKIEVAEKNTLKELLKIKDDTIRDKTAELTQKDTKIRSLERNVSTLTEAMKALDSEQATLMQGYEEKDAECTRLTTANQKLIEEKKTLLEQLQKTRSDLNEAKSMKIFTEKKYQSTESSLRHENQSKQTELQSALECLSAAKQRNEELVAEINSALKQICELETDKIDLQKKYDELCAEKQRLEVQQNYCVQSFIDSKEECDKLREAMIETITKVEYYKQKFDATQKEINDLKEKMKLQELALRETITQQDKAIRTLLDKQDQLEKKKKGIFTPKTKEKVSCILPGKYGKVTPSTPNTGFRHGLLSMQQSAPPNITTTQMTPSGLEEERRQVEQLEQTRANLKNKLDDMRNSTNYTKQTLPAPRKEESVLLKERSNTIAASKFGGAAGKTHRCVEARAESGKRCMACWETIFKGRPLSRCQRCDYVFHLACALTAGETCGLSEKKAYEVEKKESSKREERIYDGIDNDLRGHVKVRTEKMSKAEIRFIVIEDAKLKVYEHEKDRKVAKPSDIFPINDQTRMYYVVNKDEGVGEDQIAYAMKVEFYDENGKSLLYMFHKNTSQKRFWLRAISKFSQIEVSSNLDTSFSSTDLSFSSDDNKENSWSKINVNQMLCQSFSKLYVNVVQYISNLGIFLLGCDSGLYSLKSAGSDLVKIDGPVAINAISILEAANLAVFIEGPSRTVTTVSYRLLQTCAKAAECSKPSFHSDIVANTRDCYMLAARCKKREDTTVAAACNTGISLCKIVEGDLIVIKKFLLKDYITSMQMTPHSLIYGSSDVYELDTKTYENNPFLDEGDQSILYVKLINETHGSYPVAILDVSQSRALRGEPEYLVCFQDIGVFVDQYGRRTREGDVLWSHVPVAFEYRHPYLYVINFTSVEVQKLEATSYAKETVVKDKAVTKVESRIIKPEVRVLKITSKSTPNLVGEGAVGVCVALHETQAVKVMELYPA